MCHVLSRVLLFATTWTVTCQAPLSMEFSSQESWSGLPFPSPGDLPDSGIKPLFYAPALQAYFLPAEPLSTKDILYNMIDIVNTVVCI